MSGIRRVYSALDMVPDFRATRLTSESSALATETSSQSCQSTSARYAHIDDGDSGISDT